MAQILQAKSLSIEAHLRQGMSAAKVAAIVGLSDTTIKRHRQKLGIPAFEGKGRPTQINTMLPCHIVARQLCSEGSTVQPPAIRTLLKASGFTCEQEQPLKMKSNPTIHKKCMEFARNYINYTVEDWKLVIFSDESKDASPPVHAGGHIMVWGCFSSKGHDKIVKIVENMDSPKYVAVLQQGLLETLEEQNLSKSEIKFLHAYSKNKLYKHKKAAKSMREL
ncbi:hypothetical protein PHYBLDRAFT_140212 [Phycomyces blakesleeanus NRRL 1555(-)]|uniref:Homeodomain-like DNA binding domain-containing transcription factor n=1 Tax=Phycomyces blakesleeanus (strain ATCC 8743b / DSM 1359 / FGSC 10004 / NBRC 33097 / NRRL 1555) TaxID=763407 RepID=A0A167QSY5_PHYB8|nr:hypothetical protein PHYBLDRAFT_140212 [Phycomyces blakesleeanus NRRL 1555(-)]OAD80209.1 hypothetical protein PHYBLDRAFT_140212 [Phycomyces blakesleeanus NRRL 1555(-)]|eukprot:XP_018298249.1 hypothetical protein PHYBLDRAFT_140212 [Phycomyces blakesleeanus NRRL 1555(-)]